MGMVIEREHLLALAMEGADLAQTSFPTVNGLGCVKVEPLTLWAGELNITTRRRFAQSCATLPPTTTAGRR
jgi:hypothetical protein